MRAFPADPGRYLAGRALADRQSASIEQQNDRLVEALIRGIESGVARPIDPEQVAVVLWAAWNGIISLAWRPDAMRRSEPELRELLATATDLIANGLLRQPAEPGHGTGTEPDRES